MFTHKHTAQQRSPLDVEPGLLMVKDGGGEEGFPSFGKIAVTHVLGFKN